MFLAIPIIHSHLPNQHVQRDKEKKPKPNTHTSQKKGEKNPKPNPECGDTKYYKEFI